MKMIKYTHILFLYLSDKKIISERVSIQKKSIQHMIVKIKK